MTCLNCKLSHLTSSVILAMAMILGTLVPALAYSGTYTAWHNGSKMQIELEEDTVVIRYVRPKQSLRKHGVRSGTILFSGHAQGNRLEGEARVFRRGCSPRAYWVSGRYTPERRNFTLRGDSPRLASGGGCNVVGYTSSGSNAVLGFNKVSSNDEPGENDNYDPDEESDIGNNLFCGWYAIYTCHRDRNAAIRDMNNQGYGGVIDTNDVPNFTRNYWCVVDGPTDNKSQASRWRQRARADYDSPYIKNGC